MFKHGYPIITTNELTLGEIREMFFPTRQKLRNYEIFNKYLGTRFRGVVKLGVLVQGSPGSVPLRMRLTEAR